MTGKIVTLTHQEMTTAATVGCRRWISGLANGHGNRYSPKNLGEGFQRHILCAMSEMVVAREFNLFWPDGVGSRDDGDVGGLIEVRCRPIPGPGLDIGFKQTDTPKNKPTVLVHVDLLAYTLIMVGWIYAKDGWDLGKENRKLPGVRFVRPKLPPLRTMDELHSIIRRQHHDPQAHQPQDQAGGYTSTDAEADT